uniref:Pentatricopeptide repeat-containing protein n=1 Tax=Ananas comosus var. bracteatus TaxID=296719 RepID=A0A6V7NIM4_ANACO|nr:unnamed protein product [Ananas comosus var. bracteatus]
MRWRSIEPDDLSFSYLLKGLCCCCCSSEKQLDQGKQLHCHIVKAGWAVTNIFVSNALVDFYSSAGDLIGARRSFDNAAVEVFGVMVAEGVRPDNVTLSATIKAASSAASPSFLSCQILHSCAVKSGLEKDEAVSCSLMDAYARSGCITFSCLIFERLENPNVVCFTTLISAYGRNGMGREAVALLDTMIIHESGSRDRARQKALCMHGKPSRARRVAEGGNELMEEPSLRGHSKAWSSLLQNCRVHGDEEMGRIAAEALIGVESTDAAAHLQVFNFYSEIMDFENAKRVKEMMGRLDASTRDSGCSMIEANSGEICGG